MKDLVEFLDSIVVEDVEPPEPQLASSSAPTVATLEGWICLVRSATTTDEVYAVLDRFRVAKDWTDVQRSQMSRSYIQVLEQRAMPKGMNNG